VEERDDVGVELVVEEFIASLPLRDGDDDLGRECRFDDDELLILSRVL
jgi:hypothetical protein